MSKLEDGGKRRKDGTLVVIAQGFACLLKGEKNRVVVCL